jgi:hypothetical protein
VEIKQLGGYATLHWNGTKTRMEVLSVNGKLVLKGDSSLIEGECDYFVKITDDLTFQQVINILSAVEG